MKLDPKEEKNYSNITKIYKKIFFKLPQIVCG